MVHIITVKQARQLHQVLCASFDYTETIILCACYPQCLRPGSSLLAWCCWISLLSLSLSLQQVIWPGQIFTLIFTLACWAIHILSIYATENTHASFSDQTMLKCQVSTLDILYFLSWAITWTKIAFITQPNDTPTYPTNLPDVPENLSFSSEISQYKV